LITSTDAEKACNKIQHSLMMKAQIKLRIKGMYFKMMKAMYDKHIANITLNEENL
jgi:hypothetical protein